jgi:hypothetical protein
MHKREKIALLVGLVTLLILSACTTTSNTDDWKIFTIEEEPALNIQFRLPPRWLVDYAPHRTQPGRWDIILIPPRCVPEQENDYQQNCVSLVAHIKEISTFNKESFFELTSGDIALGQERGQSAVLLNQDTFRVNRLEVNQFNHLISSPLGEVEMSSYFFETDSAYFTIITSFPYEEPEFEAVKNFELLLRSIELVK